MEFYPKRDTFLKPIELTKEQKSILKKLKKINANKERFVFQRLLYVWEFHETVKTIRLVLNIPNEGLNDIESKKYLSDTMNPIFIGGTYYQSHNKRYTLPKPQLELIDHFFSGYSHIFGKKAPLVKTTYLDVVIQYILKNDIDPLHPEINFERLEIPPQSEDEASLDLFQITFPAYITKEKLLDFLDKNYQTIKKETSERQKIKARYSVFEDIETDILVWNTYLKSINNEITKKYDDHRIDQMVREKLKPKVDISVDKFKDIRARFRKFNTSQSYYFEDELSGV